MFCKFRAFSILPRFSRARIPNQRKISGRPAGHSSVQVFNLVTFLSTVVDPNPEPDWFRIQWLCGFWVRMIGIQGQEMK
jgi:hypothetical protein